MYISDNKYNKLAKVGLSAVEIFAIEKDSKGSIYIKKSKMSLYISFTAVER
jgi:hypothetical protein